MFYEAIVQSVFKHVVSENAPLVLTLFRPGGFRDPQKFSSITLGAFELILSNLVTFPII